MIELKNLVSPNSIYIYTYIDMIHLSIDNHNKDYKLTELISRSIIILSIFEHESICKHFTILNRSELYTKDFTRNQQEKWDPKFFGTVLSLPDCGHRFPDVI